MPPQKDDRLLTLLKVGGIARDRIEIEEEEGHQAILKEGLGVYEELFRAVEIEVVAIPLEEATELWVYKPLEYKVHKPPGHGEIPLLTGSPVTLEKGHGSPYIVHQLAITIGLSLLRVVCVIGPLPAYQPLHGPEDLHPPLLIPLDAEEDDGKPRHEGGLELPFTLQPLEALHHIQEGLLEVGVPPCPVGIEEDHGVEGLGPSTLQRDLLQVIKDLSKPCPVSCSLRPSQEEPQQGRSILRPPEDLLLYLKELLPWILYLCRRLFLYIPDKGLLCPCLRGDDK